MLSRIRAGFLSTGWLLPTTVPAAFHLGRALGNVILGIYLIWALLSIRGVDLRVPPKIWIPWLLMLGFFSLGIPGAIDPLHAFETWLRFGLNTSVFFFTVAALSHQPGDGLLRAERWLGWSAVVVVAAFAMEFAYSSFQPDFDPARQISGTWASYLLPFLMVLMLRRLPQPGAVPKTAGAVAFVLILLVFANSRTEVLGAVFALLILGCLWTNRYLLPAVGLVVLIPVVVFLREPALALQFWQGDWDLQRALYLITSKRSAIWQAAIAHPPANPWIGVGMDNGPFYQDVLLYRGLHNVLFDVWYETGWLGLVGLVSWLGVLLGVVLRSLVGLPRRVRLQAAPWLASVGSVLVAAMLDRSYQTADFSFYLMMCLACLYVLSRWRETAQTQAP